MPLSMAVKRAKAQINLMGKQLENWSKHAFWKRQTYNVILSIIPLLLGTWNYKTSRVLIIISFLCLVVQIKCLVQYSICLISLHIPFLHVYNDNSAYNWIRLCLCLYKRLCTLIL